MCLYEVVIFAPNGGFPPTESLYCSTMPKAPEWRIFRHFIKTTTVAIKNMFFICLDTRAFWRSVCVTKFANPYGPSFWINAFQITERAIQPIQIDMM